MSAHSVLITEEGKPMTYGRNQFGQLGIDNTVTQDKPMLVSSMQDMNIISAACGRNHTLFLTDTGTVYACGDNRSGQCGVGNLQPQILTPTRINYRGPPIVKVSKPTNQFAVFISFVYSIGGLRSGIFCNSRY